MIITVRRSRLFCAFLTSATRAFREAESLRCGRLDVGRPEDGRPEPAAGRADFAAELFVGGLVGGFLATVSFGAVRWRARFGHARDTEGDERRESVGEAGRARDLPTTSRAKCTFRGQEGRPSAGCVRLNA
jgi:hypothetical protein